MIGIIVFGAITWASLLGMTSILLWKSKQGEAEEKSYSLVEIVKELLLRSSDWAVHHSKEGFFSFLRVFLISTIHGYRRVRKMLAKYHTRLVHYIDGKDALKKRQAASLYMKNISVHKDEAKKTGKGHIVE